jgi:hypothetical protein
VQRDAYAHHRSDRLTGPMQARRRWLRRPSTRQSGSSQWAESTVPGPHCRTFWAWASHGQSQVISRRTPLRGAGCTLVAACSIADCVIRAGQQVTPRPTRQGGLLQESTRSDHLPPVAGTLGAIFSTGGKRRSRSGWCSPRGAERVTSGGARRTPWPSAMPTRPIPAPNPRVHEGPRHLFHMQHPRRPRVRRARVTIRGCGIQ